MNISTVAILGRPNVGKSTLFNRLLGKRKSIVAPIEGVTRDRVFDRIEWLNKEFILIDTGGYVPKSNNLIDEEVRLQAEIASKESDIILLVVDGKENITSSDQSLVQIIHKLNKPCILIVNKIDDKKQEDKVYDFYSLGIENIVFISAQNGRQVGLLLDEIYKLLPDEVGRKQSDDISFAIVGMPNVGKSSLMNTLLNEKKSIVTDIAGTTRDSIDSYIKFKKKIIRIIDTAGLRKKTKINDSIEFFSSVRTFRVIDDCDIAAVMVDADKGFNTQDKNIIRYVIDKGKGIIVLVNKWDLIIKETNTMKEMRDDIINFYPYLQHHPILFISVKNRFRVDKILDNIMSIHNKTIDKIKTSDLNFLLEKIVRKYPPPSSQGKQIKLNYITQVSVFPLVFAIYTNYPKLISVAYKRYLDNQIRANFDLSGLPSKISFRKK